MNYKTKYKPGYKNNHLKLLERIGTDPKGQGEGVFECDCGNRAIKKIRNVVRGATRSCGAFDCEFNEKVLEAEESKKRVIELLEPTGTKKNNKSVYTARCHCGSIFEVVATEVRQGKIKSCGCLNPGSDRYKNKTATIETRQSKAMKLWVQGLGL